MPRPSTARKTKPAPADEAALVPTASPLRGPGITMALVYTAFLIFYQLPVLSEPRWAREVFLWPALVALGLVYVIGWRRLRKTAFESETDALGLARALWISFGLFTVLTLFLPLFHSTDLTGYINRGWQQVGHHTNPYVTTVAQIPGWEKDAMFTNHWVNNPCPYGFAFALWAKALAWLGHGNMLLTQLLFKLGNVAAYALAGLAIWGVTGRLGLAPGTRLTGLYLWLWSPLMLLHVIGNGHNDVMMGALVAASIWLGLAGQWLWVLPVLTLSVLIKYGSVVIGPIAMLWVSRRAGWKVLVAGSLLSLALIAILGAPYLGDWQDFAMGKISRNATVSHHSIHSLFLSLFKYLSDLVPALEAYEETVRSLLIKGLLAVYAALYGWLGWRFVHSVRHNTTPAVLDSQMIWTALGMLAGLVALASAKFYPWYFGMFLPLAAMVPGTRLSRLLWVMSVGLLASFTFVGQAHVLNVVGPLLLPALWFWWRHRKDQAAAT